MATKYGQYIVVDGSQLETKIPKSGIGVIANYDPYKTYVINLMTKKIVGSYYQTKMAHLCAEHLDKTDRAKADAEMEKILREES